METVKLNIHLE